MGTQEGCWFGGGGGGFEVLNFESFHDKHHTSHVTRHTTPACTNGAQETGACACSCLMQADASDMGRGLVHMDSSFDILV